MQELSERYRRQTSGQLNQLRDAIATGAAADVRRIAHSATGSSAMCGLNPIAALLGDLERTAQTGQLADAPRMYGQIKNEFARIEQCFRDHVETEVNLRA